MDNGNGDRQGNQIICRCSKLLFDGLNLKGVSIAQFGGDFFNLKCKQCKAWINGLSIKILSGEVTGVVIDQRKRKEEFSRF